MLNLDPKQRISAKEALSHPYFHSEPLPCLQSELPDFKGDFSEYTTKRKRKEEPAKHKGDKKVAQKEASKPHAIASTKPYVASGACKHYAQVGNGKSSKVYPKGNKRYHHQTKGNDY